MGTLSFVRLFPSWPPKVSQDFASLSRSGTITCTWLQVTFNSLGGANCPHTKQAGQANIGIRTASNLLITLSLVIVPLDAGSEQRHADWARTQMGPPAL